MYVCKTKITIICMYSITENKKSHSLKCNKISIMKQNMWFVLAEWLSSVNANDEIKKYTCRPTKRKCKLAQA